MFLGVAPLIPSLFVSQDRGDISRHVAARLDTLRVRALPPFGEMSFPVRITPLHDRFSAHGFDLAAPAPCSQSPWALLFAITPHAPHTPTARKLRRQVASQRYLGCLLWHVGHFTCHFRVTSRNCLTGRHTGPQVRRFHFTILLPAELWYDREQN